MKNARYYGVSTDHYSLLIVQAYGTMKKFIAEATTETEALEEVKAFIAEGNETLEDDRSWRFEFTHYVNGNCSTKTITELKN